MWEVGEFCVWECTHKNLTYQEFPNLFYYSSSSTHPLCNYTSSSLLPQTTMVTLPYPAMRCLLVTPLQNKYVCLAVVFISCLIGAQLVRCHTFRGESPSHGTDGSCVARNSYAGQSDTYWQHYNTAIAKFFPLEVVLAAATFFAQFQVPHDSTVFYLQTSNSHLLFFFCDYLFSTGIPYVFLENFHTQCSHLYRNHGKTIQTCNIIPLRLKKNMHILLYSCSIASKNYIPLGWNQQKTFTFHSTDFPLFLC